MRISDWSSDVCSSDLDLLSHSALATVARRRPRRRPASPSRRSASTSPASRTVRDCCSATPPCPKTRSSAARGGWRKRSGRRCRSVRNGGVGGKGLAEGATIPYDFHPHRSEEHTSERHSLMRISYAVFCL